MRRRQCPRRLPSSLLERRPDVRQAEDLLAATTARIGAAKANYFPRVLLTAAGGAGGVRIDGSWFGPQGILAVAPQLTLPIFNMGRVGAGVDSGRGPGARGADPLRADRPAGVPRGRRRPRRARQAARVPYPAGAARRLAARRGAARGRPLPRRRRRATSRCSTPSASSSTPSSFWRSRNATSCSRSSGSTARSAAAGTRSARRAAGVSINCLATVSMVVPSTFHRFFGGPAPGAGGGVDVGVAVVAADRVRALPGVHAPHPPGALRVRRAPPRRTTRAGAWLGPVDSPGGLARRGMDERDPGRRVEATATPRVSPLFIGIVLSPWSAALPRRRGRRHGPQETMDLVRGHRDGSCLQIAPVTPVLVLSSRFIAPELPDAGIQPPRDRRAVHGRADRRTVAADGRSNWYKGVQLVAFYLILARRST